MDRAWHKKRIGAGGGLTMEAAQVTTENLNFYRKRERAASFKNQDKLNAFRRDHPHARPVITAKNKEAMVEEGR